MPQVVCAECLLVLTSFVKFAAHICKIQEMYKEILKSEEGTPIDMKFLYAKYEIDQDVSQLSNTLITVNNLPIAPSSIKANPCNSPFISMQASTFSDELVYEPHTDVLDSDLKTNNDIKDPLDEDREWESSRSLNSTSTFEVGVAATKNVEEKVIENTENERFTKMEDLNNENMPENYLVSSLKEGRDECKYLCKHCPKRFQRFNSFMLHLKKKHGLVPPIKKNTAFPCPNCDLIFQRKALMSQHIKSVHADKTSFICEECGEIMGSKGTLRDHMHTHSNYAPFECKECGKCFKQKTRLMVRLL